MTIGDIIREGRIKSGLSQSELADKIGVTQTDISRWETSLHKPTLKNLMYLCETLEIDIGEYMRGR